MNALDKLAEEYKKAEIVVPKKEKDDFFLLNEKHPIWKWLLPVFMVIVGALVCLVGYWED
ncbi:hypothetical protein [Robertmurraya siralis]|uniref:hypothetical protein n=1 Tax=Robertmurraya siralis TaxID=77777 RepID=UPI0010F82556|nr:hypothetical protein [Robertmurraya siralis]